MKALITGVNGQDGSYLAEFLLDKDYDVYGTHRRCSASDHLARINHLAGKMKFICADMLDAHSLDKVIREVQPDEVYNLAAQSQVRISFDQPFLTNETNWIGVERLLDSVKNHTPNAKIYQASTSEMYGETTVVPQNEDTPFNPVSPYGKSKLKAHEAIGRERRKGLFACGGILFNHESPRRGLEFVTRKITDGMVRVKLGVPQRKTGKDYLELGNLAARRDWGFAGDYVKAMHSMLQQDKPKDYVISTGVCHSVKELVEVAAEMVDIKLTWTGEGVYEKAFDASNNKLVISINPEAYRPFEVNHLRGDSSKAEKELGWTPDTPFENLIGMMVETDMKHLTLKPFIPY